MIEHPERGGVAGEGQEIAFQEAEVPEPSDAAQLCCVSNVFRVEVDAEELDVREKRREQRKV